MLRTPVVFWNLLGALYCKVLFIMTEEGKIRLVIASSSGTIINKAFRTRWTVRSTLKDPWLDFKDCVNIACSTYLTNCHSFLAVTRIAPRVLPMRQIEG